MIATAFKSVGDIRNWLFDRGYVSSLAVGRPVVSVGNLTFGGTGKTPFVSALLDFFEQEKVRVGVVSRGYGRETSGCLEVVLKSQAFRDFGDEPTLLRSKHPTIPIWVGEKRVDAALALLEKNLDVKLIVADDAFQHRALKRDLNIVLIDAAKPLSELDIFPWGRARESLKGLLRADFVILTRAELSTPSHLANLKGKISPFLSEGAEVLEGQTRVLSPRDFSGHTLSPQNYFAVSGIGSPEGFEKNLESVWGKPASGRVRWKDHHVYTQEQIQKIERNAKACGAQKILTTEKDEIKIRGLRYDRELWGVLPIQLSLSSNTQRLYERLRSLVVL